MYTFNTWAIESIHSTVIYIQYNIYIYIYMYFISVTIVMFTLYKKKTNNDTTNTQSVRPISRNFIKLFFIE